MFQELHTLFDKCIEVASRVPDEHREPLLEIAERLLALARKSTDASDKRQNAPSTERPQ